MVPAQWDIQFSPAAYDALQCQETLPTPTLTAQQQILGLLQWHLQRFDRQDHDHNQHGTCTNGCSWLATTV
jgi:hypothetical protein